MSGKVKLGEELMFPNDYLTAVEFKGRDVTLTITGISKQELQVVGTSEKKVRPVMTFKETRKKLVLNKTNGDSLAVVYGLQAKDWIGKRVTLYPTRVKFGREMVDAIRVREKAPPTKGKQAPAPEPEPSEVTPDDINAVFGPEGEEPVESDAFAS